MTTDRQCGAVSKPPVHASQPLRQVELRSMRLFGDVAIESVFGLLSRRHLMDSPRRTTRIRPEQRERVLDLPVRSALEVRLEFGHAAGNGALRLGADALLPRAEELLYRAKERGRNRVES